MNRNYFLPRGPDGLFVPDVTPDGCVVDGFFGELPDGDDPTRYASMAARIPEVPAFGEPDPSALVYEHRARNGQPATPEKETGSSATETEALSALDRAAQKGIIKKNNAARRKSRLMKKLNDLRAAKK